MKTFQDLTKDLNCSESELKAAMHTAALTLENINGDASLIEELKGYLKPSTALAVAEPTGAVTKAKSKGSKLSATKKASAQSKLQTTEAKVNDRQLGQFSALAQNLGINADSESEAMAELILAYPALVDAMTAQKVEAGLAEAPPAYDWGTGQAEVRAKLQAITDNFYAAAGL